MSNQTAAPATPIAIVTKPTPWSVDDTISRIERVLAPKGIKLFVVIDHSGEAQAARLRAARKQGRDLR